MFWKERVEVGGLGRGDAAQDVREVGEWIVAAAAGTDQQGVEHRTAPSGVRMPYEHPVLLLMRSSA